MSEKIQIPEEGIQIAPVFLEQLQSLNEEMKALERYFEAASNMYLKASERLLAQDRKLWDELLCAYGLAGSNKYEVTPAGKLIERKPEEKPE